MAANLELMEDNFEIIDQTGYHQNISANFLSFNSKNFLFSAALR